MRFTHLHVHSNYTLLGGTASVNALAERAALDGMTHLALTDSNSLIGAVAFARACHQNNIQPITGMTLNVAAPDGFGRNGFRRDDFRPDSFGHDGFERDRIQHSLPENVGQLVLLAINPDGYRSLCRLSSAIQGRLNREQLLLHGLGFDQLKEASQGLICLSGGRRQRKLLWGRQELCNCPLGRFSF